MDKSKKFKDVKSALAYLHQNGWKISERSFYNHLRRGFLRRDDAGQFDERQLLRYARTHLLSIGAALKTETETLQREKILAEVGKLSEQEKLLRIKRRVAEGKYVLRSDFELELASRGVVLCAYFTELIQMKSGDMIQCVNGDPQKVRQLMRFLSDARDQMLNEFCNTKQYHVLFQDGAFTVASEE